MLATSITRARLSERSLDFDRVAKIPRQLIGGIEDMKVEGKLRNLGIVKNFKNDDYLKHHLPSDLSISWTHLDGGEELEPHTHPVASMIVITKGTGRSLGDSDVSFEGGDILYIPAYNSHGFVGTGDGFWALSIQFQETAIFETEIDPLTTYSELRAREVDHIEVISRSSLPAIHEVEVGADVHNLGIVKNFGGNEQLKNWLPSNLSLAWVHLDPAERLDPHRHPEASMIIVTDGVGRSLGALEHPLEDGDVLFVPSGHDHGFVGGGDTGFWALSVQFNETSLYEEPELPRVVFVSKPRNLDELMRDNDRHAAEFVRHPIFSVISEDTLADKPTRMRFLAALQVWSGYFQRIVLARSAFVSDPGVADCFYHHLLEELGHHKDLEETHDGRTLAFDPALEGMGAWFVMQTLSLDNVERIVMTNLVLERAGREFYTRFSKYLAQFDVTKHFEDHSEHDEEHERIGFEYLETLTASQYARCAEVQGESWNVIGGILDRVFKIATNPA